MIQSIRNVLSNKKGVAEALGITLVGLALLSAAGVVVANYAIISKQSSQLQSLTQEVTNRAEQYASALNANLVTVPVPDMSRKCSTTPAMCTTITAVDTATAGKTILTIKADGVGGIAQTITRYPTLLSQTVTHVTAIDAQGNKTWALSGEGLHYDVWGLAVGVPSKVKPADMAGPTAGTSWVSVADRAGIDSAGDLWVWGKNDIGQAGIGSISAAPVVPKKITGTTSFRSVVTGDDRGYAIDSAGAPWVWGKNDKGQLGLGTTTNVMTPTKIAGSRMMTMAIGKDNIFGITMDGRLATAGVSQAGFPANTGLTWQVLNPGTQYKAVAASTAGAVAIIENTGKLTMAGQSYPFTPMAGGVFTSVSLGATGGYAIGGSGKLYSWGLGADGQLGLGDGTTTSTEPTPPPSVNVAGSAAFSGSSQDASGPYSRVVDGSFAHNTGEWITQSGLAGSYLNMAWSSAQTLDKVVLYDRVNLTDQVTSGTLTFSDGSTVAVPSLDNAGAAVTISFPARATTSLRFTVNSVKSGTLNIGLGEMQVFTAEVKAGMNVVGFATFSGSSQDATGPYSRVADGSFTHNTGEWITQSGFAGSYLNMAWSSAQTLNTVVLYDRLNLVDQVTSGTLTFSDGSTVAVPSLNDAGAAVTVTFPARATTSLRFTVNTVKSGTLNIGLGEMKVITAPFTPVSTTGPTTSAATPTQVMPGTQFSEVSGGKTSAFAVDVSGKLYYFGKTPSGVVGSPDLPVVNVPTPLLSESSFRGIASNNTNTSVALLDTAGNVYGLGTVGSGLWPMTYSGSNNQPIRMPVPAGFSSNTW